MRCSAPSPASSCSASATRNASSTSPPRAPRRAGAGPRSNRAKFMTRIFPIALVLEDRPCLVVGANADAAQRAAALLQAGARVSVITERPDATHPELEALASAGRVTL